MKSNVVERICKLPHDFKTNKDKSIFQLLKESGYFEQRNFIRKGEIIEYLDNCPELLNDWELYSLDKRTGSGWYLLDNESNWTVGYCNSGKLERERIFSSKNEACAVFIINEIEEIAK